MKVNKENYFVAVVEEHETHDSRRVIFEAEDYITAYNFMIMKAVTNLNVKYKIFQGRDL